jgi:hypothetical protein
MNYGWPFEELSPPSRRCPSVDDGDAFNLHDTPRLVQGGDAYERSMGTASPRVQCGLEGFDLGSG